MRRYLLWSGEALRKKFFCPCTGSVCVAVGRLGLFGVEDGVTDAAPSLRLSTKSRLTSIFRSGEVCAVTGAVGGHVRGVIIRRRELTTGGERGRPDKRRERVSLCGHMLQVFLEGRCIDLAPERTEPVREVSVPQYIVRFASSRSPVRVATSASILAWCSWTRSYWPLVLASSAVKCSD